ncbi:amino acid decarboxylase [Enterovibrio baiacu]|uniref:amino acid decarboxylase n=1 Tax=Enterovibrio baiacu TaxID=2491023 RepID=UPI001011E8D4|nr:amino acid decarboxylase [Enterovibrio baiacu]MBE1273868.1 amino acid decarboxylase [Enterovibrio baiacu]
MLKTSMPHTPFYVYDQAGIQQQCDRLKTVTLPDVATVLYSLKANPNPSLVETIVNQGLGCDVSSAFELDVALSSGVAPKNIGCVGPYKSTRLLTECVRNNIAFVAVESAEELVELGALKRRYGSDTAILLRLNPNVEISGGSMKMGGAASQFGITEDDLPTVLALAKSHQVAISGVHIYATTRVLDPDSFIANFSALCECLIDLQTRFALPLDAINLGGGFGIPYYKGEAALAVEPMREALLSLQQNLIEKTGATRLFFESGRFIVGENGKAVIQVKSIKQSGGKTFVVCDGGYNLFHGATAFANLMRKPYFINKATRLNVAEIACAALPNRENTACGEALSGTKAEAQRYTLVGPLCTPSDIIADKFDSAPLAVGDYLVVHQVGAYAITSSPGLFIGHGFPAEYLVTPTGVQQVGKQDSIEEMKRRYTNIEQEMASESLRRVS